MSNRVNEEARQLRGQSARNDERTTRSSYPRPIDSPTPTFRSQQSPISTIPHLRLKIIRSNSSSPLTRAISSVISIAYHNVTARGLLSIGIPTSMWKIKVKAIIQGPIAINRSSINSRLSVRCPSS